MKTFKLVLVGLFMIVMNHLHSQCTTYKIVSNLGCAATIDFVMYDTGCTNVCNVGSNILIGSNSSFNLPCGQCSAICNIQITITDLGGNTMSAVVDFTNTTPTWINNIGAPCSTGNEYVTYDPSTQTFKLHQ